MRVKTRLEVIVLYSPGDVPADRKLAAACVSRRGSLMPGDHAALVQHSVFDNIYALGLA